MSVVAGIEFRGGPPSRDNPTLSEMEVLEVRLNSNRINTALRPSRFAMFDDPRKESREEYGYRLRSAARDAARLLEDEIVGALRSMGHFVV